MSPILDNPLSNPTLWNTDEFKIPSDIAKDEAVSPKLSVAKVGFETPPKALPTIPSAQLVFAKPQGSTSVPPFGTTVTSTLTLLDGGQGPGTIVST